MKMQLIRNTAVLALLLCAAHNRLAAQSANPAPNPKGPVSSTPEAFEIAVQKVIDAAPGRYKSILTSEEFKPNPYLIYRYKRITVSFPGSEWAGHHAEYNLTDYSSTHTIQVQYYEGEDRQRALALFDRLKSKLAGFSKRDAARGWRASETDEPLITESGRKIRYNLVSNRDDLPKLTLAYDFAGAGYATVDLRFEVED